MDYKLPAPRDPMLSEIPCTLAEIDFEIMKSEAC